MKLVTKLLATLALMVAASSVQAQVITFDDIGINSSYVGFGNITYSGLSWGTGWFAESNSQYSTQYGNTYGAVSGEYAAFNGYGYLEVSVGGGVFDFNGAYFTGWGSQDTAQSYTSSTITVEGYNSGSLVGNATMVLGATGYNWLQADLLGIDSLKFIASGSSQWWLMDDMTINVAASNTSNNSVPEPASLALMGLGLIGMGFLGRKKKAA